MQDYQLSEWDGDGVCASKAGVATLPEEPTVQDPRVVHGNNAV